jgi:hypothetical protein
MRIIWSFGVHLNTDVYYTNSSWGGAHPSCTPWPHSTSFYDNPSTFPHYSYDLNATNAEVGKWKTSYCSILNILFSL